MKLPPKTRLLGHPLIVIPMVGVTLWSIIAWAQGGNGWLALLAIVSLTGVAKAHERRSAYLAYRREWESLAPPASSRPARRSKTFLVVLAVLLVGGAAFYLGLTIDQPGHALALAGIVIGTAITVVLLGLFAVVRAILRSLARRRARQAVRIAPVEVCVARPLLAVPSLPDAYRALPSYCWRILS